VHSHDEPRVTDESHEKFNEPHRRQTGRQFKRKLRNLEFTRNKARITSRLFDLAPDRNAAFARFRIRDIRDNIATKLAHASLNTSCTCPDANLILERLDRIEKGEILDIDSAIESALEDLRIRCSTCALMLNAPCTSTSTTSTGTSTDARPCIARVANPTLLHPRPKKAARGEKEFTPSSTRRAVDALLQ
jgi:hypothetical protein